MARGNWLEIGWRVLPHIATAVASVEKFVDAKGQAKQDAAVEMVKIFLVATEGAAAKDLLNDPAVEKAVRELIDAYVAVQNVIATRGGAKA